jgi:pimeloyl-ACP methyl ester carboxylesterase
MQFPGNPRRVVRRLAREAATTVLALVMGLGSWLFGPPAAAATVDAGARGSAALPGVAVWRADRIAGHPLPDPRTATPQMIARFFAGLDAVQRSGLVGRYPQIVGNLDGAPLDLRLAANARTSSWSRDRHLIGYDPRGDGRVAEVVGDLGTADRIAILVPGCGSRLSNFDHGNGGLLRRSPAWQARQLYAQAHRADPAARVAVIAWLGYDAPEGFGRASFREERARSAAAALSRFVAGVGVYRPDAAVTLVGHSYGSVVAGLAASTLGPQVHDIVALGSPGMGVERVAELRTKARVWAGTAATDWTRDLPGLQFFGVGHGRLPIDVAFGARLLPVGNVYEHDGYFMPGADSLVSLAQIMLGGPGSHAA